MSPCCIVGGCKYPHLNGGGHVCSECTGPLHNLCLQQASGTNDAPEAWLCGVSHCYRHTVTTGGTASASAADAGSGAGTSAGGSSTPPGTTSPRQCAAGSRCVRKNGTDGLAANCETCGALCHLHCLPDVNNIEGVCVGCSPTATPQGGKNRVLPRLCLSLCLSPCCSC